MSKIIEKVKDTSNVSDKETPPLFPDPKSEEKKRKKLIATISGSKLLFIFLIVWLILTFIIYLTTVIFVGTNSVLLTNSTLEQKTALNGNKNVDTRQIVTIFLYIANAVFIGAMSIVLTVAISKIAINKTLNDMKTSFGDRRAFAFPVKADILMGILSLLIACVCIAVTFFGIIDISTLYNNIDDLKKKKAIDITIGDSAVLKDSRIRIQNSLSTVYPIAYGALIFLSIVVFVYLAISYVKGSQHDLTIKYLNYFKL